MDWARIFFEKILPCIVIKPRFLWIFLLGGAAVCGAITIFYYPKLTLPDSSEFQILSADHPFEKYDLVLKDMFWFEKIQKINILAKLPVRFVWGILPVDNGDYMNPRDKGTVEFDDTFNIARPESQQWLLSFCKQLRNQSFYQSTLGPLLPHCFIETFMSWMTRRCVNPVTDQDRSPCCENSTFPFSETVFNKCIHLAVKALYETPAVYNIPGIAGPRFNKETGKITALVVEYDSIYSFSVSYVKMHKFVTEVETWLDYMLSTAPEGMRNGWFTSFLSFYDLQQSLLYGTLLAIVVAMGISFAVLFLTTLNILISLYAILTITSIIFVTVGTSVLIGWKMNVVESITVTVAIGLSIDFTLHYGILYKLSADDDRESRIIFSLSRMGSPVAMAAFTTFIAGVCMMPSSILAYLQIGTFIMIIMTTSWLYATFFFQSILRLIGPQKKFGQFNYPTANCCQSATTEKVVYNCALSESTLDSSSTNFPIQVSSNVNESHELEPLTGSVKDKPNVEFKQIKHSAHVRSPRHRSGSLSTTLPDNKDSVLLPSIISRKISLPTSTTDPSQQHISSSTSSTTIMLSDEDYERIVLPNKTVIPDIWVKRPNE